MAALPVLAGRVPRVPPARPPSPAGAVLLGRGFLAFGFPGVSKNAENLCLKIVYLPAYLWEMLFLQTVIYLNGHFFKSRGVESKKCRCCRSASACLRQR